MVAAADRADRKAPLLRVKIAPRGGQARGIGSTMRICPTRLFCRGYIYFCNRKRLRQPAVDTFPAADWWRATGKSGTIAPSENRCGVLAAPERKRRLTRTHTSDSQPFRSFLPFSPWWATAHLRPQKTKIPRKCKAVRCEAVLPERKCSSGKEKAAENTLCTLKGFDAD